MNRVTPTETGASGPDKVMDVRTLPCSIKHGQIVQAFLALPVGDFFILRNGHDPVPLRRQLEAAYPGAFAWEYLHRRPEDIAVKITKLAALGVPAVELPRGCDH